MIKIGGIQKTLIEQKQCKLNANMGEFINFIEIGGICIVHHWPRGGWTPLELCTDVNCSQLLEVLNRCHLISVSPMFYVFISIKRRGSYSAEKSVQFLRTATGAFPIGCGSVFCDDSCCNEEILIRREVID